MFNPINFAVYHYAGNNPIKYIDPTGLASIVDDNGASRPVTNPNKVVPTQTSKEQAPIKEGINLPHKTLKINTPLITAKLDSDPKNLIVNGTVSMGSKTERGDGSFVDFPDFGLGYYFTRSGPAIETWAGKKSDGFGYGATSTAGASGGGLTLKLGDSQISLGVTFKTLATGGGIKLGASTKFELDLGVGGSVDINVKKLEK